MRDDFVDFGIKFAELCTAFNETQSKERIDIYWSRLRHFDIDRVCRAIDHIIDHSRFFPKVAEIRDLIEGSTDDRAAKAWQLLLQAIEAGGYYKSIYVEDPAMAAAIDRTWGGWIDIKIPQSGEPMHASLQKQFCNHYRMAAQSGASEPQYFPGAQEAENRQSVATWREIGETLRQRVVIISGDQVFTRELDFDCQTGALSESSRKALTSGLKPLPPAPVVKLLPEAAESQELASAEEIQQVLAAMARLAGRSSMPQN